MITFQSGVYHKEPENRKPELPVKLVTEGNRGIITAKVYLHSLMKKQAANVINGRPETFDEQLYIFLENFYEQAYSNGLRDNDQMHRSLDKTM